MNSVTESAPFKRADYSEAKESQFAGREILVERQLESDRRSLPARALDGDAAADARGALPHRGQAELREIRARFERGIEADAVIGHCGDDRAAFSDQRHRDT